MRIFKFLIIAFTVVVGANCGSITRSQQQPLLHFNENGKFKIVHFADLHYAEAPSSDWGPANDLKSNTVLRDVLGWEKPDFVAFTGDLISEEHLVTPNGTAYIDQLLQPLVEGGYSWASTYGNHDSGPIVTREDILATEQKYPGSYTQQGADGLVGTTNYFVPVYAPVGGSEDVPALILWFFDSRGGRSQTGGIPATVDSTVVEWFKEKSKEMTDAWGRVPSLAYFHYPTAEYKPINDNIEEHPECPGQHDDVVSPQNPDTGLMTALATSGIVKATFVGHNHGNGWCCNYESMVLCYNRQSGHGGGWVGWTRGARVIELSYDALWGSDLNYVRLENGTAIDFFPVNN